MTDSDKKKGPAGVSIDRPRLTPQARSGQDSTAPSGKGERKGQRDKPEG